MRSLLAVGSWPGNITDQSRHPHPIVIGILFACFRRFKQSTLACLLYNSRDRFSVQHLSMMDTTFLMDQSFLYVRTQVETIDQRSAMMAFAGVESA
mmetsp:Transcript_79366/g.128595  ORF Transcript_79366/g.128595 Transcript_79366/m.128595 type:complete len:96 (+) Transcript_79366:683-970(+)